MALSALYYVLQTEPLHLPGFALTGPRFFLLLAFIKQYAADRTKLRTFYGRVDPNRDSP
jgi:hypothetical protein